MTPSLEQRDETTRPLRSLASPLPRAVADEYPLGYVAQLARPFATRAGGPTRFAPCKRGAGVRQTGSKTRSDPQWAD
jgi:hypothetical protein